MKKIKLLFAAVLSMMAWTGVMADEIDDANAAITNDAVYRIYTLFDGSTTGTTKYYLKANGYLTDQIADAKLFTFTRASGGSYAAGKGYKLNQFTNGGDGNNNITSEAQKHIIVSGNNNRDDFEGQVFFLNSDGDYAIRSTNANSSGWAASAFWTVVTDNDADGLPNATYTMGGAQYIWKLEGPISVINVTYNLVEADGTTLVSSSTVKQEANSAIASPLPGTGINYNGNFHEKFYYNYTPSSNTVGDTDCTITITRTEKAGVVKALTDLSNTKAYYIGCDRGAMIAYDGKMVNTALNNATVNAQPLGKFALLNYEDNYYIFSVDENKFIKNDASVALDLTEAGFGAEDAMVMTATTAPYFLWHFNAEGKYLNTNGNAPLGYVINSWSYADEGNQYYMVEAADFDPTDALAELNAYFHPSYFVTYVVKDEFGNTIFTSDLQPAKAGATITTLLDEFKRPFYTYNEVNVEIAEQYTTVEFTATWNGPFEISADFDNAHWYDMAMRMVEGNDPYYVTSAVKDGDGAYKTQLANTMGLVEDSYQWAFIAIGYGDGIKIINKAAGAGKSFGWTDETATNAGIPTIMSDSEGHHAWKIVLSTNTSVPAGSFCLNVPGTSLYINQYGGAGGSVKFWDSGSNVGDAGSAFTVFDVPTDFASYVVNEIAPSMEIGGYFSLTDDAKAAIGYDESYKTECSFEQYKSMKEALAVALADMNSFELPQTGYYILKNKNYGTYMGIDPSDCNLYGNYENANLPKHIVKLTKEGAATYTISLEGVYAPASVAQSQQVTATAEAGTYTVSVPTVGYAAFQADTDNNMSVLHQAGGGSIVGWEAPAAASQWEVIDAKTVHIEIAGLDEGEFCGTFSAPFPIKFNGQDLQAYQVSVKGENAVATPIGQTVPANAGVILYSHGSYTFDVDIVFDNNIPQYDEIITDNALVACIRPQALTSTDGYVLGNTQDYGLGFYRFNGTLAANRAYLPDDAVSQVKSLALSFDNTTAIEGIEAARENAVIYNLAGQRVQKAQKGIYIMNGKKAVVK